MKSSKLLLSVFALAAFAAAPVIRAEGTAATPPAAGASEHKGFRGERLKEIVSKLDLTDDQKAKIKPIVMDASKAMKAVHEDESLDRKAKMEKVMEIFKSHADQVAALLTPEQLAKFKELREKGKPAKAGQ